uniref:Uncharacterized protein n=1 Tax=Arundo donax TaxID=35708 RepID=A0A0A9DR81_ARUDO
MIATSPIEQREQLYEPKKGHKNK